MHSRNTSEGTARQGTDHDATDFERPYGLRTLGASTDGVVQYAGGGSHHPGAVESAQQGFSGAAQ